MAAALHVDIRSQMTTEVESKNMKARAVQNKTYGDLLFVYQSYQSRWRLLFVYNYGLSRI